MAGLTVREDFIQSHSIMDLIKSRERIESGFPVDGFPKDGLPPPSPPTLAQSSAQLMDLQ